MHLMPLNCTLENGHVLYGLHHNFKEVREKEPKSVSVHDFQLDLVLTMVY